jgi:hypothetical protein
MAKLLSTQRSFIGSLLIFGVLMPVLLMSSLTPTRATPVAANDTGVELSPGYPQAATPGQIVTYTHTLTNTGTTTDTFTLDVSSSQGWPVSLLSETGPLSLPLQLDAGLTTTFMISLSVPTAAISGTVDLAVITATSQTSPTLSISETDTTTVNNAIWYVYLPLVLKRWPPIPDAPVLNSVNNPSNDGTYNVTWNAAYLADSYTLEEDDNAAFSSPTANPVSSGTAWLVTGQPNGTYYYRVKAVNAWGESGWSNLQSTTVNLIPDVPVLNPVSNPFKQGFYSVTWNVARMAASYVLEEDDNASFSSPTPQNISSGTSWFVNYWPAGTYYYRVKAINAWGESGWSSIQSTTALPGMHGWVTYHGNPISGVTINLMFFNGSSTSAIRSTTTKADGSYQLVNLPTLIPGQQYYASFSNSASSDFVAACIGAIYSFYYAGTSMWGGDFDIANIPQISPPNGATITLPYTFQWTKRSGVPSDSYKLEIWSDNAWWNSDPLGFGYVSSYTMNTLPSGLSFGTSYHWDVAVQTQPINGGGGSYCRSFDQNRTLTFSSGVAASQDIAKRPRSLHDEDIQR